MAYFLLLLGCLVVTLPLEVVGARVYRRAHRLVRSVLPVAMVFLVWDVVGAVTGQWAFTGRGLLGLRLPGGLPVEEVGFFAVVPVCALLTWEGIPAVLRLLRGTRIGRP